MDKRRDSLVARLRTGDHAAAAELVDIYYEQIYLFMKRLGHNRQVSEDLTQETFLQVWRHIGQLRDGTVLNSWLYRIAGNASRMYRRRHKGKRQVSIEGIDVPETGRPDYDKAERSEQLGRLKNAVAKLPRKKKQAVVLHYMQHLTITEAAQAAGIRKGTLKSRLNRALELLREQIK